MGEKAKGITKAYASAALLFVLCIGLPKTVYAYGGGYCQALCAQFTHVNAWHLAANIAFVAAFRPRWTTVIASVAVGTAAVILARQTATCGLSAVCFAMLARKVIAWGRPAWEMLAANAAFALLQYALPSCGINYRAHIYAFILSALLWKIYYAK